MRSYQIAFTLVNHTPSSTQSHSTQKALLSAEQHAHFCGKLRPADEKQRQNVDKNFTNFSFRHLVEFSS